MRLEGIEGSVPEQEAKEKPWVKSDSLERSFQTRAMEGIEDLLAKSGTEPDESISEPVNPQRNSWPCAHFKEEQVRRMGGVSRAAWDDHTLGNLGWERGKEVRFGNCHRGWPRCMEA